jgi:hypothetical protein
LSNRGIDVSSIVLQFFRFLVKPGDRKYDLFYSPLFATPKIALSALPIRKQDSERNGGYEKKMVGIGRFGNCPGWIRCRVFVSVKGEPLSV